MLGYTDPRFARDLAHQGITQAVFSPEYAAALSAAAAEAGVSVACHLKVDTGMGRLGFGVRGDFDRALAQLKARPQGLPPLRYAICGEGFFRPRLERGRELAAPEREREVLP